MVNEPHNQGVASDEARAATPIGAEPVPVSGIAGIANAVCCNCRFWRRNKFNEPPPEPETHGKLFGIRYQRDDYLVRVDRYIRNAAIERNESGRCHLNPNAVSTHGTHWCAGFMQIAESDAPQSPQGDDQ